MVLASTITAHSVTASSNKFCSEQPWHYADRESAPFIGQACRGAVNANAQSRILCLNNNNTTPACAVCTCIKLTYKIFVSVYIWLSFTSCKCERHSFIFSIPMSIIDTYRAIINHLLVLVSQSGSIESALSLL